jgi:decaprenylphospho-beta-D-ribofuranose 2-oxidase
MALPAARHLTAPGGAWEEVAAWGVGIRVASRVHRPRAADEVAETLAAAAADGLTVGFRGGGQSIGDASLNADNVCLDLTAMNRVRAWDPGTGTVTVEPGVTVGQLCRTVIPDGWLPPVVPGTMFATIGGCAAANVHGKNHWKVGTIGEHVVEFELVLPSGELQRCRPGDELFRAAIGGFGMLGCFASLTLRCQRVHSGFLRIEPVPVANFEEAIAAFEARKAAADYLVGWVDGFARGAAAGRGLVHQANHLAPGEDPDPGTSLGPAVQHLPGAILGLVPASLAWRIVRPVLHDPVVRLVNETKYRLGRLERVHRESHTKFSFLLNRMPGWERAYGRHGLVQYQSFVPIAHAARVFRAQIELAHEAGIPPYMGIFKRHRADDFLVSYGVDGFSLGLDFKVTRANRARLPELTARFDRLVVDAAGRFYLAKDSTLTPASFAPYVAEPRMQRFLALKGAYDPGRLLETNLFRRILGAAA